MTKVLILTTFEGTLIKKSLHKIQSDYFYQSLLQGYKSEVIRDPHLTPMKDSDEVQALFEKKFGVYSSSFSHKQSDADLLMCSQAIEFFHSVLRNKDVSVNIITTDRADYIQALFRYQGFSKRELSRLNIVYPEVGYRNVSNYLGHFIKNDTSLFENIHLYLINNNIGDEYYMGQMAVEHNIKRTNTHTCHSVSGFFDWESYGDQIKKILPETKQTVLKIKFAEPKVGAPQRATNNNALDISKKRKEDSSLVNSNGLFKKVKIETVQEKFDFTIIEDEFGGAPIIMSQEEREAWKQFDFGLVNNSIGDDHDMECVEPATSFLEFDSHNLTFTYNNQFTMFSSETEIDDSEDDIVNHYLL